MKKNSGITLVALIITVIILLIFATVSINLVINNGILDKAKLAVDKYSEGEICEQIKLSYLECETEKLYNSNIDTEEFLTNSLKEKLSDNTLTVKYDNGKVIVNMTVKNESKTYIYKSNTGVAFEYVDPFDYGDGKTKLTVGPEDDITLGTEKFKVISNTNNKIFAMPYYNLVTVNADGTVKQGPAVSDVSTAISNTFSTTNYWLQEEDAIEMTDNRNNIQTFINKYKTTLENMGVERITVRAAKYSELTEEGVTDSMRNPSGTGGFWLCSAYNELRLWAITYKCETGNVSYSTNYGVRPIIVIDY